MAKAPVGADRTISATLQPTLATVSAQLDKWASAKQYDVIVNWVFSPATGFQFASSSATPPTDAEALWSAARDVVGKDVVAIVMLIPNGALGQGMVGSLWMRKPLIIATWGFDLSVTDNVLAGIVAAQPTQ